MSSLIHEPIAIVGMSCRLPAADDLDEYWSLLVEGKSAVGELPPDRLDRELYYDPEQGVRGKTYSTLGGLVKRRPLDPDVMPLRDGEYQDWDPCHLVMCEVACAACRHAGYDVLKIPLRDTTGVYIGHSGGSSLGTELVYGTLAAEVATHLEDADHFRTLPPERQRQVITELTDSIREDSPRRNPNGGPALEANAAALLVARTLGLGGPHLVTDAACASSLMALMMGILAVQSHQVDMAIVGGASYSKADSLVLFSQARSCSATGSRPFDDDADGLISSEGYVALVIKTLARARHDGDTVQAIISGLGVSSDGRGRSLWAPRKEGQVRAMRRAYADHLAPETIQYVEAHATSTQIGDATELQAMTQFFGERLADGQRLPVGSVKSNIGHTLETAGMASLLKTVLAMQHRVIPPTINLRKLNRTIPWDKIPFYVPTKPIPWPAPQANQPRRAAVSAFGIGGLNVHLIVENDMPRVPSSNGKGVIHRTAEPRRNTAEEDAIAVIGRGVILPQAHSVEAFAELLASGRIALSDAPSDRWRDRTCLRTGVAGPWRTPTLQGGFISDYAFDWHRYRIPPKQIAHANPLQFMLLDAARQAIREAGYEEREFDREQTAVIVGTIFGGEFGHDLVVGLRLPDLKCKLERLLTRHDLPREAVAQIWSEFEAALLRAKPALIDETGSFTSSTLASRVSKELDLMGGAMAIDAGECSSFAALDVACNLLRSTACRQVLCAGAQRAMDIANYEALALKGRLPCGPGEPGQVPGEGVVMVLLKRLVDAQADGDRVLGIVRRVAGATDGCHFSRAVQRAGDRLAQRSQLTPSQLASITGGDLQWTEMDQAEQLALAAVDGNHVVRHGPTCIDQIGHLLSAHGLTKLVEWLIDHEANGHNRTSAHDENQDVLSNYSTSGLAYQALLERPHLDSQTSHSQTSQPTTESQTRSPEPALATNGKAPSGRPPQPTRHVQLTYADRVADRPRVAFLFPGQGSQYPGMLRDLPQVSLAARRLLDEARRALHEIGSKSFEDLAWHNTEKLGRDIWANQISVLIADLMAFATLREAGVAPDRVCGHSFGEFAAMVAADVCTLEQGIRLTQARAKALTNSLEQHGSLLSLSATAATVSALIGKHRSPVSITHYNSPTQTVVGGTHENVAHFKQLAKAERLAGHLLDVPCAFHTPLMQPSQAHLRQAFDNEILTPPSIPWLINVGCRYVAEPDEIRDGLVQQLVEPVHYEQLITRLAGEGVTVFLEVGPQQVLTRLNQRILADRGLVCLAMDVRGESAAESLDRILAQLDGLGYRLGESDAQAPRVVPVARKSSATRRLFESSGIQQFDATQFRKRRQRRQPTPRPAALGTAAGQPLVQFDATANRRGRGPSPPMRPATELTLGPHAIQKSSDRSGHATSASLEKFLIEFVVEHTGYPAEILELDWDLEADLGIDSIKKAQLFGELREFFDLEGAFDLENQTRFSLDEFRTLRQVLSLLEQTDSKGEWLQPPETTNGHPAQITKPAPTSAATDNQASLPTAGLEQFLVDFVVEHTGYPPEIVELDADFEADLGIDSIKKAQLFGELREHFSIEVQGGGRFALEDFRTLRSVLDLLQQTLPDGNALVVAQQTTSEVNKQTTSVRFRSTSAMLSHSVPAMEVLTPVLPRNGAPLPITRPNEPSESYRNGKQWGQSRAREILSTIQDAVDQQNAVMTSDCDPPELRCRFTHDLWDEIQGVADGTGLAVACVAAHYDAISRDREKSMSRVVEYHESPSGGNDATTFAAITGQRAATQSPVDKSPLSPDAPDRIQETGSEPVTYRHVLRTAPAPQQPGSPTIPELSGAGLIVGTGPICDAIQAHLHEAGQASYVIEPGDDPLVAAAEVERIWGIEPTPHLFLVTPRGFDSATTFDLESWKRRRSRGVMTPFWVCQRWVKLTIDAGVLEKGSLVAVASLGGDFGFSTDKNKNISAESGALTGLLKSIIIESWMSGHRTLPIKVIDAPPTDPPAEIVAGIFRELAVPSYDVEVCWSQNQRQVVRALRTPLDPCREKRPIPRGGNWVCTGGGRGITAYVVKELGRRYGLKLHLLGTSPPPAVPESWRDLTAEGLKKLKLQVMTTARAAGHNPIQQWQRTEKAIEIDQTLRELAELGIEAEYSQCDVSCRESLKTVLDEIRRHHGPIDAVLHGAGVGKDGRFENKNPEKVNQCIQAKVDGALALMELTRRDPLKYFVAFGSISGRFGANGHTDYSLSNDMLAKLVDWYRGQRPEVGAVAFHWHAWGDVGMATKPETRLALEMIDMQFMPAAEGLRHLIGELEAGVPEGEILITDDRYYRLFYPYETLTASPDGSRPTKFPLLDRGTTEQTQEGEVSTLALHPGKDPFLVEHRLDDKPLLPIVIGLELVCEAAARLLGPSTRGWRLTNVQALNGLRFHTDQPHAVCVLAQPTEPGPVACTLTSDVVARNGKLVEARREYLRATIDKAAETRCRLEVAPPRGEWHAVEYPQRTSKFYLGPPLRCLQSFQLGDNVGWGRVTAPAAIELTGPRHSITGWIVPSAALDACLYATGLLAWIAVEPGVALPESIAQLTLGRFPKPGEACLVETRFLRRAEHFGWFDFALYGVDGELLIEAKDYRIVWLPSGS